MAINDYFDIMFIKLSKLTLNDNMGGKTVTWSQIPDSNFKASLKLLGANERKQDDKTQLEITHKLTYPISVSLSNSTRIRRISDNTDFEVLFPEEILNHHKKAEVSEII